MALPVPTGTKIGEQNERPLTGNVLAGSEGAHDLRIEGDAHVPLLRQLLIARCQHAVDPLFEWAAHQGVDDVDDMLSQ